MPSERRRSLGLLVLRVVVGIVFIAHGYFKGFNMGMGATLGMMTHLAVPLPQVAAWFAVLAEIMGGIALILGIFTLPFCIALVIDMCGAIYFAKRGGGLFAPKGFELELTLLACALTLALTGPGSFSLASLIHRKEPATS